MSNNSYKQFLLEFVLKDDYERDYDPKTEASKSGARPPGSEFWLCHLIAGWLWAIYLNFSCLVFLNQKLKEMVKVYTSRGGFEEWVHTYSAYIVTPTPAGYGSYSSSSSNRK